MWRYLAILLLVLINVYGCSSKEAVRHLSSDVCLIVPENNNKKEVQEILGPPDNIKKNETDKSETWIYYQVRKSTLKKMPLIGKKFGSAEYDIITVSFENARVKKCIYRSVNKEDLIKFGIKPLE
jgi:hypothetical protein